MSKEKQISAIARDFNKNMCSDREVLESCTECAGSIENSPCPLYEIATRIYNAGYRKQSEGEWVTSDIPQEKYVCSVCGGACWYYDYQGEVAKSRYCPNCGAKMKGGAE